MDNQKQQLVDKLKGSNNILVTVSSNPSIDQLSAAIGLTLFLNKLGKHATAVFSGQVPSTLEFLKPEDTLEKTTDSLRDFIISLDKAKADKLRYKVEENVVKIFITPYRTSLSSDDLEFSQGDFNVDAVVALGVHEQQDLDQAIVAHGRILHDATVMSVNVHEGPELGSVNWTVPAASSLAELVTELADALDKGQMDGQIATALLTGIVAETDRFSNEKTSPETMKLSAELLTAGANQQLVSTELQKDQEPPEAEPTPNVDQPKPPKHDDGTLEIAHSSEQPQDESPEPAEPGEGSGEPADEQPTDQIHDVKSGGTDEPPGDAEEPHSELPPQHYLSEPPVLGGQLTGSTDENGEESVLGMPDDDHPMPILSRNKPGTTEPEAKEPVPASEAVPTPAEPPVAPAAEAPQQPVWQPEPTMELPTPSAPATELPEADVLPPLPPAPEVITPQPAAEPPTFEPPAPAEDQIKIDADGNIQGPALSTTTESAAAPDMLANLEQAVDSPHLDSDQPTSESPAPTADADSAMPDLEAARKAVEEINNSTPVDAGTLPPKQDVGASGYLKVQDLPDLSDPMPTPELAGTQPEHGQVVTFVPLNAAPAAAPTVPEPTPGNTPADTPLTMPLPPAAPLAPTELQTPTAPAPSQDSSIPPVPPPLPPSVFNNTQQ